MKIEDIEKAAGIVAIISGVATAVYYGFQIRKTIKETKEV